MMPNFKFKRADVRRVTLARVAGGGEAFALARLVETIGQEKPIFYIMRGSQAMAPLTEMLAIASPGTPVLQLPGWDCLPYDRVSPGSDVASRRIDALGHLINLRENPHRAIVLISANALLQKLPPMDVIAAGRINARVGARVDMDKLVRKLARTGFDRVPTVRDVGEYAVRGGILDVYVPGSDAPIRLDFFGDNLESIREFDPASQRTTKQRKRFTLNPMSEVTLNKSLIAHFRKRYIESFGAPTPDDALYAAISEGRRFAGMEHWLPLFYEKLDTVFELMGDAPVVLDYQIDDVLTQRFEQIEDHYDARLRQSDNKGLGDSVPYKPVKPEGLYLSAAQARAGFESRLHIDLTPFDVPKMDTRAVYDIGLRNGRNFATERNTQGTNVFEVAVEHIRAIQKQGRRAAIAGWTEGSLDRLCQILAEHGVESTKALESLADISHLGPRDVGCIVAPFEHGLESDDFVIVAEADLLGDRMVQKSKRRKKGADFINEVASLAPGDVVVHVEHGIGRFIGLKTVEALGAPHDCVELHYAGDDRLFLPVENIELLSRFGSDSADVPLDKLGGVAWQSRKAKLKKRLLDMAGELIQIAAARAMRGAPVIRPSDGVYAEFAARFPYEETEDQQGAIDNVMEDLAKGTPMDRLICGDVGFGKTEVALRAAFLAAMEGLQVAVVVPTTLLARQHFKTFKERFQGLPINIAHASRLVGSKALGEAKRGVADGTVDIIVGTHALLGESISFKNLGMLIIDEEQRFGVKHKERLKELKSDVHVLTLSATPIPRTLQLALTGVRELSLITTAPVDRMAVRTFISPFDALVIRETLLRERYRGGQSFYVVPRISDLEDVAAFLRSEVPELKFSIAHGQMAPGELEDVMNAFYEGQFDVLLSTTIVESGLDISTANTLVVHRADMFGLAQLYQIRGRVGRSKLRAYALFTLPAKKKLTDNAERRLKVLQTLDTLGAGFQLASHDLDLRGAGNLLGDQQSGHIREVGFELYQQMLEEAVAELKGEDEIVQRNWSPSIAVGTSVMIPENYVADLHVRLSLYRRLGDLSTPQEIDAFGAEMIDRFGPLPEEVEHLLKIVFIKALCRKANVEKVDAGPKGVVIQFRDKNFANPAALVGFVAEQGDFAKIRPDQSIYFKRDWRDAESRLRGSAVIMSKLAKMAEAVSA